MSAMTTSEILSESIAAFALFVAWLARLDSKKSALAAERSADAAQKSADAAQRTNELISNQHEFEKQKLKDASEPVFAWRDASANIASVSYNFQNMGSRIRVVSCESNPPASRIDKPNYVDGKQQASFTFVFLNNNGIGAGIPKFEFTVSYETQLKEKATKRFLENQHNNPVELN